MNSARYGCGASDARDGFFSASLEACRYDALLGLPQAPGFAGGHDLRDYSILIPLLVRKAFRTASITGNKVAASSSLLH